jgi:hypothetical protein
MPMRSPVKLPLWRKLLGGASGLGFLGCLGYALTRVELGKLYTGTAFFKSYGLLYLAMFLLLGVFCACITRRAPVREQRLMTGRLTLRFFAQRACFGGKASCLCPLMLTGASCQCKQTQNQDSKHSDMAHANHSPFFFIICLGNDDVNICTGAQCNPGVRKSHPGILLS